MTRQMPDCTHVNVQATKRTFVNPPLVAGYLTGTPDIQWIAADYAMWPNAIHVTIDQAGPGSPIASAMVRDVESGAWQVTEAVKTLYWHTPRPTIYCSRATIYPLIAAGWRGDVWLADPGYSGVDAPVYPGIKVVAVQHEYTATYDLSTVYDDTWPYMARTEQDMIDRQLVPNGQLFIPFPPGSFKQVILYRDFLTVHNEMPVRVAYHSKTNGYVVDEVIMNAPIPYPVEFAHTDVDAVSIENRSNIYKCGVTVA